MATKRARATAIIESHDQIAKREDDEFNEQHRHLSELIRTRTVEAGKEVRSCVSKLAVTIRSFLVTGIADGDEPATILDRTRWMNATTTLRSIAAQCGNNGLIESWCDIGVFTRDWACDWLAAVEIIKGTLGYPGKIDPRKRESIEAFDRLLSHSNLSRPAETLPWAASQTRGTVLSNDELRAMRESISNRNPVFLFTFNDGKTWRVIDGETHEPARTQKGEECDRGGFANSCDAEICILNLNCQRGIWLDNGAEDRARKDFCIAKDLSIDKGGPPGPTPPTVEMIRSAVKATEAEILDGDHDSVRWQVFLAATGGVSRLWSMMRQVSDGRSIPALPKWAKLRGETSELVAALRGEAIADLPTPGEIHAALVSAREWCDVAARESSGGLPADLTPKSSGKPIPPPPADWDGTPITWSGYDQSLSDDYGHTGNLLRDAFIYVRREAGDERRKIKNSVGRRAASHRWNPFEDLDIVTRSARDIANFMGWPFRQKTSGRGDSRMA